LEELVRLFELLGEYGIGTDKNVGGGKFTVETQSFIMPEIPDAHDQMLLSLYIPTEDELSFIDLENSRYELCQRGGYMAGSQENDFWHLRKKSVYMLGVGSILKTTAVLKGKVVDLQPADYNDSRMHPVYRSGKPFVVPVK
jgi:CRISPR type III-A-associated RAMP protein Csm4